MSRCVLQQGIGTQRQWKSVGSLHYVSFDNKLSKGMKIKKLGRVESGVVLCMEMVKNVQRNAQIYLSRSIKAGTAALESMVSPCCSLPGIVSADSNFFSMETAKSTLNLELYVTGNVKAAILGSSILFMNKVHISRSGSIAIISSLFKDGSSFESPIIAISKLHDRKELLMCTTGQLPGIIS